MTKAEFITTIRNTEPGELADLHLAAEVITAFPVAGDYAAFKARVLEQFSGVDVISIVGTGNWRFSLNPDKYLKEFDSTSDIDVAVISEEQFTLTWEELRHVHRRHWYVFPFEVREKLRRNAENVYAGFVTPAWIPSLRSDLRYRFKSTLNRLRDESVAFRPVKMLFFKNRLEAVDYYKRGFLGLKRKVEKNEI